MQFKSSLRLGNICFKYQQSLKERSKENQPKRPAKHSTFSLISSSRPRIYIAAFNLPLRNYGQGYRVKPKSPERRSIRQVDQKIHEENLTFRNCARERIKRSKKQSNEHGTHQRQNPLLNTICPASCQMKNREIPTPRYIPQQTKTQNPKQGGGPSFPAFPSPSFHSQSNLKQRARENKTVQAQTSHVMNCRENRTEGAERESRERYLRG